MVGFLLFAVAILVPPLGIVLVWAAGPMGTSRKVLASLALAALSVLYLRYVFGMRVEVDGTGLRPIVSFGDRQTHYENLERSRELQSDESAPPVSESASESESESEPEQDSRSAPESASMPTPPSASASDVAPTPSAHDWPRFRGPAMDGRYDLAIRTSWPEDGLERLWKQPVGGGYASFVAVAGRAFTIEQRRDREVTAAYDVATGHELWTHGWTALFQETMGGDGPRATPTWDEGRLYALGATGELKVFDAASGEVIWERNILEDAGARNLTWGMAASPLIVDETVVVLPGGSNGRSIIAYDKWSGDEAWSSLDDTQAYTSPILVTLAGRRQIVVVGARRAMGVDAEEGALLWEYPWVTNQGINVAQPVILDDDRVFLSAAYGHGAAVVEISGTGTGTGAGFRARPVWSNIRMKNKFTSSVLHEGYLYGLDEAILACIDAATGELRWKGGRYGYGQILLASGHLVVLTEYGELVLVEATPNEHVEKARFQAIEGKTWNHPAIADGVLLVRNANEMAAFRIAP